MNGEILLIAAAAFLLGVLIGIQRGRGQFFIRWRDWGYSLFITSVFVVTLLLIGFDSPRPQGRIGFCYACFNRHVPEAGYGPIANPDGWLCGRGDGTRDERPDAAIGDYLGTNVDGRVFGNGRFDLDGDGRVDLRDWAINARERS